jgi:hypothetical protein
MRVARLPLPEPYQPYKSVWTGSHFTIRYGIREYQLYLFRERKLAAKAVSRRVAELRFFYVKTLKRHYMLEQLPFPRLPERLPTVLSREEVGRLVACSPARQGTLTALELSSIGSWIPLSMLIDDYLRYNSDPSNPNAPVDTVNPCQRLAAISRALGSRPANAIKPYEIEDWLRGLKRKPG